MRDALGDVQSVLVLGGGSDIALATIRALQRERLQRVLLAVRDPSAVVAEVESLRSLGLEVECLAFDAADLASHAAFVAGAFDVHEIDLVLVAFGVLGSQSIADHDAQHAVEIVHTNYQGAVSVLVPIADALAHQGHGTIAVLSSVAALRPRRANFVYASSKAGLDSFANGLADMYAGTGVHVMIVRPGFVTTQMTEGMSPAPFATTPDVVAAAIVDGIRRSSTVVYAPAILRLVMPALQLVPRFVWRRMRA
jgi:decaprenylphospho-beta-D-erythro-pentofuranosid-2-ulose 2-reductase